jgi:hypothetical protein
MGGTIEMTVSISMILLFSIAIIGFSIGFANDNNSAVSVADDENVALAYTSQKSGAVSLKEQSEGTYASILDTTVEPGSDVVPSAAPFALTGTSLVQSLKNIVALPVTYIFGGKGSSFGVFFTILISIISLMIILYVYKTWKGNP